MHDMKERDIIPAELSDGPGHGTAGSIVGLDVEYGELE
jgi:hypothetical protein